MRFLIIRQNAVLILAIIMFASLFSCHDVKIPVASADDSIVDLKPTLPKKVAREAALKNGNAFYVYDLRSRQIYVFSFIDAGKNNYIDIFQFEAYGAFNDKRERYRHYKNTGRITLPYENSISWVYDFNYNSYLDNGRQTGYILDTLFYYQNIDGVVIETPIHVNDGGDDQTPRYEESDPTNNDFYRQLVHDMLKFNIITKYTLKYGIQIPTFDLLDTPDAI